MNHLDLSPEYIARATAILTKPRPTGPWADSGQRKEYT